MLTMKIKLPHFRGRAVFGLLPLILALLCCQEVSAQTDNEKFTTTFINKFFKNAKAPNQFDGLVPGATLTDFKNKSQYVTYLDLSDEYWIGPNNGGNHTIGRIDPYPEIPIMDGVTLYMIALEFLPNAIWGETPEKRLSTPISAIDYRFRLSGNAMGKEVVLSSALCDKISAFYGITLTRDRRRDFFYGWKNGIGFIVNSYYGLDEVRVSVILNVKTKEDMEHAADVFQYRLDVTVY